jgi:diguanylate cyclase (GGDEF)-like protein
VTRVVAQVGLPVMTDDVVGEMKSEIAALRKEIAMLRIANSELERVVVRDTLTPLFNRRHFISSIADRISRVSRYGMHSVIMFIDVDNMKGINDAHGHAAGDYALMHIAGIIGSAVRSTDVAARVGGDEFALILDEIDTAQAEQKMVALDSLVRETPCLFGEAALKISASFGYTPVNGDDTEFSIMARADEAMYANKRLRRPC